MKTYHPVAGKVIVKMSEPEVESSGGIVMPERSRAWDREATVVAVNPGDTLEFREGDDVLIFKGRGHPIGTDGTLVIEATDIICVIENSKLEACA